MTPVLTQSKKLTHFYFIPINKSFVHSSYKVSIINLFRSFKSGFYTPHFHLNGLYWGHQ